MAAWWLRDEDDRNEFIKLINSGMSAKSIARVMTKRIWGDIQKEVTRSMVLGVGRRMGMSFTGGPSPLNGVRSKTRTHVRMPRPPKIKVVPPAEPVEQKKLEPPPAPEPSLEGAFKSAEIPGYGKCHFPRGEVGEPSFKYCGLPSQGSYCKEHNKLMKSNRGPYKPKDITKRRYR